MSRQHIFVTGQPGVGKSTLISSVLEQLSLSNGRQQQQQQQVAATGGSALLAAAAVAGQVATGFWTEEVRVGAERQGFDVVTLDGARGPLARTGPATLGAPTVGKYVVDVASFERLALPSLVPLPGVTRLVVIDEVGKMELFSERFYPAVLAVLAQPGLLVLGSVPVPRYGRTIAQVEELKARPDVQVVTVSKGNRDQLVASISKQIQQALALM